MWMTRPVRLGLGLLRPVAGSIRREREECLRFSLLRYCGQEPEADGIRDTWDQDGGFHYKPSSYGGTTIYGNPHLRDP